MIANGDYLTRVADSGMGLTVTLVHTDGTWSLRVESETGYNESRTIGESGPALMAAYWHPFATFLDLPNPWRKDGQSFGVGVVAYAEALTAEASA